MRSFIITVLLASTISARAGDSKFTSAMLAGISQMNEANTTEQRIQVANKFRIIALHAQGEWLPYYYHALIYTNLIYNDAEADDDQKEKYLDIAEESVEILLEINPDDSEVQVLYANYPINLISLKPFVYGMLYMGKYNKAIKKSLDLNPDNPRARYMELSARYGKAQFFGEDLTVFCPDIAALKVYISEQKPVSGLHPSWGINEVAWMEKSCEEQSNSN